MSTKQTNKTAPRKQLMLTNKDSNNQSGTQKHKVTCMIVCQVFGFMRQQVELTRCQFGKYSAPKNYSVSVTVLITKVKELRLGRHTNPFFQTSKQANMQETRKPTNTKLVFLSMVGCLLFVLVPLPLPG
jgi:hypothetical protein